MNKAQALKKISEQSEAALFNKEESRAAIAYRELLTWLEPVAENGQFQYSTNFPTNIEKYDDHFIKTLRDLFEADGFSLASSTVRGSVITLTIMW